MDNVKGEFALYLWGFIADQKVYSMHVIKAQNTVMPSHTVCMVSCPSVYMSITGAHERPGLSHQHQYFTTYMFVSRRHLVWLYHCKYRPSLRPQWFSQAIARLHYWSVNDAFWCHRQRAWRIMRPLTVSYMLLLRIPVYHKDVTNHVQMSW